MLIYHKITVATGLLQTNAYGHELVLFCLIIPCVHCPFMFYFNKKCKWLFWFCAHRRRWMRAIAQSIDRTVIDPCALNTKSDLSLVSSSDISEEVVNILTTCFCLIFISSGSAGAALVVCPSRSIDQSITRSVAVIALYALTTKSDLELFSLVTSSDEDISIFRGYYCTYQLAERPVRYGIICEKSDKRASQTKSCFKTKTQARKALWMTLAL